MLWMFKIFDLETKDIIYETNLENNNLIGRLKTGLFTLVNGYMYYSNNVIKIRYDLLETNKNIQFKESQMFDIYLNCFKLEPGEKVKANTPLNDIKYHRFVYIISDT